MIMQSFMLFFHAKSTQTKIEYILEYCHEIAEMHDQGYIPYYKKTLKVPQ